MGRLAAIIVILILNLCGCGNSGNPDAPTSKAPHEKAWVTYHRNDIVSFKGITSARTNVDGLLINEHVIQCRVCHGAGLMGAKSGAAGPACLDCHVLDPVKYPIMCYSCHGGYPDPVMKPQQWYSTNRGHRPGLPLETGFIDRVRNNADVHLIKARNHTTQIASDKCTNCHGGSNNIGEPHHTIVMNDPKYNPPLGCLGPLPYGCHTFDLTNFTLILPDCNACHNSLP